MRSIRALLAAFLVAWFGGTAMAQDNTRLTVLTESSMMPQTELAATRFLEERADVELEIIATGSPKETIFAATILTAIGLTPDVIVAEHSLAGQLAGLGLVAGYCLPDGCEECFGPFPPRWCQYAQGLEVDVGRLEGISMVGLCEREHCPSVCLQSPSPPWCKLIHAPDLGLSAKDFGYDVVRGSFAYLYDDLGMAFPFGTPWWWKAHLVWASHELGFSPGERISREVLEQVIADFEDKVFFDSTLVFDGLGLTAPSEPNLRKGDPSPQPNKVALLLGFTDTVQLLDSELRASLVPILVDGYRPQASVGGAYVIASGAGGDRDAAMTFAHGAFSDDFQQELAFSAEYLAVQDKVFTEAVQTFLPPGTLDVLRTSAPLP